MPCTDGGIPYPPTREEKLEAKVPAMLCGLISALDRSIFFEALERIDWKEVGVKRKEFDEWWHKHEQRDIERRKKEALAKLTNEEKRLLGISNDC